MLETVIYQSVYLTIQPKKHKMLTMVYDKDFYGTAEVAQELGIGLKALQVWLHRHPEYRPDRRFNGDDMLWNHQDVERVRQARERRTRKPSGKV